MTRRRTAQWLVAAAALALLAAPAAADKGPSFGEAKKEATTTKPAKSDRTTKNSKDEKLDKPKDVTPETLKDNERTGNPATEFDRILEGTLLNVLPHAIVMEDKFGKARGFDVVNSTNVLQDGKAVGIDALRRGMLIRMHKNRDGDAGRIIILDENSDIGENFEGHGMQVVRGVVQRATPETDLHAAQLTIERWGGGDMALLVSSRTRVFVDDEEASLAELAPGTEVTLVLNDRRVPLFVIAQPLEEVGSPLQETGIEQVGGEEQNGRFTGDEAQPSPGEKSGGIYHPGYRKRGPGKGQGPKLKKQGGEKASREQSAREQKEALEDSIAAGVVLQSSEGELYVDEFRAEPEDFNPEDIGRSWRHRHAATAVEKPIGVQEDGVVPLQAPVAKRRETGMETYEVKTDVYGHDYDFGGAFEGTFGFDDMGYDYAMADDNAYDRRWYELKGREYFDAPKLKDRIKTLKEDLEREGGYGLDVYHNAFLKQQPGEAGIENVPNPIGYREYYYRGRNEHIPVRNEGYDFNFRFGLTD